MLFRTLLAAGAMGLALAAPAHAAGKGAPLDYQEWSFNGIFGSFDDGAKQRGFQVYRENCASCHALEYIAFRNLTELGYTEAQAKAIAEEYTIIDGPNQDGDMFERPGRLSDRFPSPFENPQQAAAANGGAYPPDLSLIVKARKGGADYLYSLLTGYAEHPEGLESANHWNPVFGGWIAMAPPLLDEGVEYADGSPATVEQYARDVTHFLTWAAEPTMEVRKQTGIKVILFLLVTTVLFYFSYRSLAREIKGH